jgi:hypothetical protein
VQRSPVRASLLPLLGFRAMIATARFQNLSRILRRLRLQ